MFLRADQVRSGVYETDPGGNQSRFEYEIEAIPNFFPSATLATGLYVEEKVFS